MNLIKEIYTRSRNVLLFSLVSISLLFVLRCDDSVDKQNEIFKVYVTYQMVDKVGVFNGESGEIIKEVDVDFSPGTVDKPHFVVIDEIHQKWYVTLISSGIVAKFNLLTDEFEDSVFVGNMPALMVLSPDGKSLYVSRFMPMTGGQAPVSKEVHKIDTETMTILGTVDTEAQSPHGICMDPAGEFLWVASFSHSCLFKIDANGFEDSSYEGPERFPLSNEEEQQNENAPGCGGFADNWANALQLAISPDGNTVYTSLSGKSQLRAYNTATGEHKTTFTTGMMPWHMAVSPDGGKIYVINRGDNSVSVVDIDSGSPSVTSIEHPSFSFPHGVGISGDGNRLYVSSSGANSSLHIIDPMKGNVIQTISFEKNIMATGVAVMQSTCTNCD